MLLLPANLAPLAKLVNPSNPRWATQGVLVKEHAKGAYLAYATDGHMLARVAGEADPAADTFPALPALAAAPNGAKEAIIPAADWTKAFRAIPKKGISAKPILASVAAVFAKDRSTLATTDLDRVSVMESRHIEGRFPDCDMVIPTDKPQIVLDVDARYLAEVLSVAAGFVPESAEGTQRVTLELRWTGKANFAPIVIRTANQLQTFTGLVMPLGSKSNSATLDAPEAAAPVADVPDAISLAVREAAARWAEMGREAMDVCTKLGAICFGPGGQPGNLLSLAETARILGEKAARVAVRAEAPAALPAPVAEDKPAEAAFDVECDHCHRDQPWTGGSRQQCGHCEKYFTVEAD